MRQCDRADPVIRGLSRRRSGPPGRPFCLSRHRFLHLVHDFLRGLVFPKALKGSLPDAVAMRPAAESDFHDEFRLDPDGTARAALLFLYWIEGRGFSLPPYEF